MKLFVATDFHDVIQGQIALQGKTRGYKTRLAEAAGCHRSFLSHVLNSHVLITADHALGMCRFWGYNALETDYFLTLVEFARAQTPALRERHKSHLQDLRRKSENLAVRLDRPQSLSEDKQALYYSSWDWAAIHVATSVPTLRTAEAIASHFSLPLERVKTVLGELESFGLIARRRGGGWTPTDHHLHLPGESFLTTANHANWRLKTIARLQAADFSGVHYSVVFGVSQKDAERMRQMLLDFMASLQRVCEPSTEEELVAFSCDMYGL